MEHTKIGTIWRITLSLVVIILGLILIPISSASSVVSTGDYNKDFYVTWSNDHVNTSIDGKTRDIMLDRQSGGGFASKQKFLFGQIDMQIKLVPGNSAGTVIAFYLTSDEPDSRDEIDFEFLGNVSGPTSHFHTYSILWNVYHIVFMVDWVPIRVYRNHADKGVPYPRWKPMSIKTSIWDGSDWATRGGLEKLDWSAAPFIASFGKYKIDACVWSGKPGPCNTSNDWWNGDNFRNLSSPQKRLLKWARLYHLVYDYCQDSKRFNFTLPKECSLP